MTVDLSEWQARLLNTVSLYGQHGIPIFAVHSIVNGRCTCGEADCTNPGKHPATKHGFKDATTDPIILKKMFPGCDELYNIGMPTGVASNTIVLDIDGKEGEKKLLELQATHGVLPETRTIKTSKGRHIYFQAPARPLTSFANPETKIDLRANGGYVMLPPSRHLSGCEYEVLKDVPVAVAPDWLIEWLANEARIKPKRIVAPIALLSEPPPHIMQLMNNPKLPKIIFGDIGQHNEATPYNPTNEIALKEAMEHIDANCNRDIWLSILAGIKSLYFDNAWPGEIVKHYAHEWSKRGTKAGQYNEPDFHKTWDSIKERGENEAKATIGTVIHHARKGGWTGQLLTDNQAENTNGDEPNNQSSTFIPKCFRVNDTGVYAVTSGDELLWLCKPPLHVRAYTHDENDKNHGRLLVWKSATSGVEHQHALPNRLLAGDAVDVHRELLDNGLIINTAPGAKQKLLQYILTVEPKKKQLSISRPGWHGESFALPDIVFPTGGDKVLQTENLYPSGFKTSGTLEEWQSQVACYAVGNTRLVFAICTAFAAPFLLIADEESGGAHLIGESSIGKTTALRMAGSVWGGGGDNGFIKQWRSTGNALEAVAEAHRDCLLPLDEIGQADAKTVGDTIYMLANNQGKGRMRASGSLRDSYMWRVLVLSTGEVTLEDKMREAGRKPFAGMDVRFVSVPADAGKKFGIFDTLHGRDNGDKLSRDIKEACNKYYGTAIRAFLSRIVGDREKVANHIRVMRQKFSQECLPENTDGQVKRVAGRFGLIAAAGELAIELGILPFAHGAAFAAVSVCFKDWLNARGTTGALEVEHGITAIRAYLEKHGASRFPQISDKGVYTDPYNKQPNDRMGFRYEYNGQMGYYILPEAFKEITQGFNHRQLANAMAERGFLEKDKDGKNSIIRHLPEFGNKRCYHILPQLFR